MMIKCTSINILTFVACFNDRLPPLAGYYASQFGTKDSGRLLGAFINNEPCGVLIAEVKPRHSDIIYIAVHVEYQRKGVFSALLKEFTEQCATTVRLKYAPEQKGGDYIDRYLCKMGFHSRPHLITKVISLTAPSRADWNKFLSGRNGMMLERLKERGFYAMPFSEAPTEFLDSIYMEMGKKFPAHLDPRHCPNMILEHHSFITVQESTPVAYCVVTSADGGKTAIVEHMAASSDLLGRGVFLPCLASAVNSLLNDGVCAKISFAYDANNNKLPKIMTDDTWFSDMTVKQMYEYILNK